MDNTIPQGKFSRSKVLGKTLLKIGATHSKAKVKKLFSHTHEVITQQTHEESAKLIIEALGELKGVSVKIAQQVILSLPFLPQHYLEEIGKSFNAIPPINRALIRKIIKQELASYPEELFEKFESTPFGSASLGQVHKAKKNGKTLAIKVQYPGIATTIKSDMEIVKFFLTRFAKGKNVGHLIQEINERLYEEVDYFNEAKNLLFFKKNLNHPFVVIPEIYTKFSTQKVLTCSYLEGKSFHQYLLSSPSQEEKNHYAQLLFDTFFTSLYTLKTIHADPNPGNFLFMENRKLGMIDFGCIKTVDATFLHHYNRLHLLLLNSDNEDEIIGQYKYLGMIEEESLENMRKFYREAIQPLDSIYIEVLSQDSYDFGNKYNFSKRGFETILEVQRKQIHSVHKFNQEYLFIDRTLLGYYTMFEQLGACIKTKNVKALMKKFQEQHHD